MEQKKKKTDMKTARQITIAAGIIGFILLTYAVVTTGVPQIDNVVDQALYSIRTPGLNTLVEGITYLGNWEAVVILCLLLLAYPSTRRTYGLPVACVAVVTSLIKAVIKVIVRRPRPDASLHIIEEGGFSFPSGHAIATFAVFGLLFLLIRDNMQDRKKARWLSVICAVLAFAIGISRIYLGVHYFTDVLAGWCAAAACVAGLRMIIEFVDNRQSEKKELKS